MLEALLHVIDALAVGPRLQVMDLVPPYLLSGQTSITCGDQTWTAVPGAFAFLPKDIPHVFSVTGTSPAKMLQLTLPAHFERFAAETGEPAGECTLPPPSEPDVPRLIEVMGKYGIDLAAAPTA